MVCAAARDAETATRATPTPVVILMIVVRGNKPASERGVRALRGPALFFSVLSAANLTASGLRQYSVPLRGQRLLECPQQ
jgi:hypothetical protein